MGQSVAKNSDEIVAVNNAAETVLSVSSKKKRNTVLFVSKDEHAKQLCKKIENIAMGKTLVVQFNSTGAGRMTALLPNSSSIVVVNLSQTTPAASEISHSWIETEVMNMPNYRTIYENYFFPEKVLGGVNFSFKM